MAVDSNILLLWDGDFRVVDGIAFSNLDLGLYDVDTGDFFGNGMLDLDTRIYFNKIEVIIGCRQNSTVPALT